MKINLSSLSKVSKMILSLYYQLLIKAPVQEDKVCEKIMKTYKTIYPENGIWKFQINPDISIDEISIHAQGDVSDYCKALTAFELFRSNLNKSGQSRKNALRKKSKQLLGSFNDKTFNGFCSLKNQVRKIKIKKIENELEYNVIIIEFDGRRKKNLSKIMTGIEMDINIDGGLSPQYYKLGFKNYLRKPCPVVRGHFKHDPENEGNIYDDEEYPIP
jgi:hypothetical protein